MKMADIDLATKILNIKKKLQARDNESIKLQTQIDMTVKTLKEKYNLTPEEAETELEKLEKKIKANKEKIKTGITKIEEYYELN
jgi:chromosome segregation ATPase